MLARLLFLFITVPLVEMALLLLLGKYTGLKCTIMLVITTGIAGAWLARRQGWWTYRRIQQELAAGKMPTDSLVDAAMIFVAGALLLTPGVLTDVFGMSLLIPQCRRFYQRRMTAWFSGHVGVRTYSPDSSPRHDQVIDSYVVDRPNHEKPNDERNLNSE